MKLKTHSAKPSEVTRHWYLLDARDLPLGRLSTRIAGLLIGKHKPNYTPHVDGGDYVVVINASSLQVTGDKLTQKRYYRHSGYPGSIKETTLAERIKKNPTGVIEDAVSGMLPKNRLANGRMHRLKVYAGSEHDHQAQKPEKVEVK